MILQTPMSTRVRLWRVARSATDVGRTTVDWMRSARSWAAVAVKPTVTVSGSSITSTGGTFFNNQDDRLIVAEFTIECPDAVL